MPSPLAAVPLTQPVRKSPISFLPYLLHSAPSALTRALSRALALALAALAPACSVAAKPPSPAATTLASCSWDSPGTNPYRGELAAAVDHYTDIPTATRAVLKTRIGQQRYDDIAVIGRDHVTGGQRYSPEIRDMHFGGGRLCRTVTRQRWAAQAEERGLVYCEGAHCIIVPTVCRNVSRIKRQQVTSMLGGKAGERSTDEAAGTATAERALVVLPESTELLFEAPGAGPAATSSAQALAWTWPAALTLVGPGLTAPNALPYGAGTDATAPPLLVTLPTAEPAAPAGPGWFGGGTTTGPDLPIAPLLPAAGGGLGLAPIYAAPPAAPVPEPGTAALMLLGLAAVVRRAMLGRPQN